MTTRGAFAWSGFLSRSVRIGLFAGFLLTSLAGCAFQSSIKPSAGHISQPAAGSKAAASIPAPVTGNNFVPPPSPAAKPLTYSVVVHEVPAKELLFALARDTHHNIDINPNIQGLVSINAVNETLPTILDRIARQIDLRYSIEDGTIVVMPDTPYFQTYKLNYINLNRTTTSRIGVSTQVASTGSGIAAGNNLGAQSGASGNNSVTTVDTKSENDFWDTVTDNIRKIINATRSAAQTAEERAQRQEALRATREERLQQAEAVARAGSGASALFNDVFRDQPSLYQDLGKDAVVANPVAGTITVYGSQKQHKLVRDYLDRVQQSAEREVLIEATIVEVALNDQFRAGIDWSRLASGAGFSFATHNNAATNLANTLNPFFTIGYSNTSGQFNATIDLLESFGKTRVLSSPKVIALNNQTALLKVVNNLVYFSIDVQAGTTSTAGTVLTPTVYTTTPHTVPVGVVMSVTPQITDNGQVSVVVRPTISRKVGEVTDPNPALASASIKNNIPIIQVREMESVLQVNSGQTVILGGLMQDESGNASDGLPVLSRPEGIGALFGQKEQHNSQSELVIFLRPTIIRNPSLDDSALQAFRRYLPPAQGTSGQP